MTKTITPNQIEMLYSLTGKSYQEIREATKNCDYQMVHELIGLLVDEKGLF